MPLLFVLFMSLQTHPRTISFYFFKPWAHHFHSICPLFFGDFNGPDINWFTLQCNSLYSNSLCNFIFEHNLTQFVSGPTYIKGGILDLILSDCDYIISNISIQSANLFISSDHFLVSGQVCGSLPHRTTVGSSYYFLDLSKTDEKQLADYLLEHDFSSLLSSDSVEDAWVELRSIILHSIFRFTPKVRLHSYQFPKWFTPDIRHKVKHLCTLRRRYRKNPTEHLSLRLGDVELQLKNEVFIAKQNFEDDLVWNLHVYSISV